MTFTSEEIVLNNAIKKLKMGSGFTLAETLMTVLILLMVSGVVAGGIPAAVTAYGKAVDAANAQVLISTTVNALRAELCTAKDVHEDKTNSNEAIFYISPFTGSKTRLYLGALEGSSEETIIVQDFYKYDESGPQVESNKPNNPRRLVTKSAATKNLEVTFESFGWATDQKNEVLVFNDIKVAKNGVTITSIPAIYIRCLGVDLTQQTGG